MNNRDFTWIDPNEIPKGAHLLHHENVWCVANDEGKVLVYKIGTGRRDANALQCNRNKSIADRFLERYRVHGATQVIFCEHVFLADNIGRYV